MCCFRPTNCCCTPQNYYGNNNTNRTIYIGVPGPQGPSGILSTGYFVSATSVNANPVFTTITTYPSTQTNIVLNSGTNGVTLTAGTYIVDYGTTVVSTGSVAPTISLAQNGTTIATSTHTTESSSTTSMSGEYVLTVTAGTILSVVTTNDTTNTYNNTYLSIKKIA